MIRRRENEMFRVILWSNEEKHRAFQLHLKRISFRLRQVTAIALNFNGPEEVSFLLAVAPRESSGRVQILCVADPTLALEQVTHWRNAVGVVWADLANEEELADIAPLFLEEVEVCPSVPVGESAVFKDGQLIRK
ncbi:hypothetical protein HYV22_03940 [Candidatus Gottesmanbacteria bacterium]|nr:hypothetical protein [Candidatus Gottesmanbacteria bacterium]